MGDLLGKDKRKGFYWPILIYDSLHSTIPKSRWMIFLAINESERPIGGILSMTHYDRRSPTKDASSERDKDSSSPPIGRFLSVARFILLAILLPSRYGC